MTLKEIRQLDEQELNALIQKSGKDGVLAQQVLEERQAIEKADKAPTDPVTGLKINLQGP